MSPSNGIEGLSPVSRCLLAAARNVPGPLGGKSCFRKFVRRNRGRPYEIRTKRGFLFAGELGDSVDNQIAISGDYETHLSDFISETASAGTSFLDIGCNIGWFSCLVGSVPNPPKQILSIDANPRMVDICGKNLALNNIAFKGTACALGSERGRVTFHIPEHRHSRASVGLANTEGFGVTNSLEVDMVPLVDLLDRFPGGCCDLIKMDIEGYELTALRSVPTEIIERVGTIVFEYSQRNLEGCGFGGMTLGVLPWLEKFHAQTLDENGQLRTIANPAEYKTKETTIILQNRS